MAASNYIALLNTAEQPKEVGVIVEYLQQCPLAYALLSTSSIPQYLISDVVPTAVISPRVKSKQFDVEFDLFQTTLVLPKEEFSSILGLPDNSSSPKTFVTPTSAQLLTMFKDMGYKFEDNSEPCLSRIKKSCLPTPWHFLTSVLTRCLFGSVGGRSKGKTDLWILMYGLFYDVNVDYTSILWDDFLNFLPASKNKFLIHHPRWWSIILHNVINNSNLTIDGIPEGPKPQFLCMTLYRMTIASTSESSHPVIIPDTIVAKIDANSASLRSYQKYIKGTISPPKKKRKHSDHASKKLAKKKKQSKFVPQPPIPSPDVSDDNQEAELDNPISSPKSGTTSKSPSFLDSLFHVPRDYDEPPSSAPVSPARVQSVLESPNHRASLGYDSIDNDNQDDDNQSDPETFPQGSPLQDHQDEDTPIQTVDIPSSEGLIVDDETSDMSIVLYSNASAKTFSIDLDDYSPPTPKESQEKDDVQDDDTPKETDEANTTEPQSERIRLTAQMVADGIAEIRFHTSSHSKYL
ncbi:unnamed protein product [Lactuca virosa]|uniref:Aminotransferase-like plant mobile domain-containing protein n=1 Tax=Lactuca virosa TaxID=75947 RepID=A0AAU9PR48_9ASTR|nr:unnamed protein product [Lactuca virosa]